MEKSQIHRLLERIQILLDENSAVSPIEKDIILDYLRRAYEAVNQLPVREKKMNDIPSPKITPEAKPESDPELQPESAFFAFESSKLHFTKPARAEMGFPKQNIQPVRTHDESSSNNSVERAENDMPLQDLFDVGSAKELSEKIGAYPVKDLGQAFSINDRLLIINELFGGDSHYFSKTIESINRGSSFEEVKSYLIQNIVDKFGWADSKKQQTVKAFLKLVRRRFQD